MNFQRLAKAHDKHGTIGVLRKGWRSIWKSTSTCLSSPYYAFKARSSGTQAKTYNDFFFELANTDRAAAEKLHQEISNTCSIPIASSDSIQRFIFATLAAGGFQPKNILEIGTEHGQTAHYLSTLFPEAQIYTVNLPTDDPIYMDWHPEGAEIHDDLINPRLAASNIHALRVNTVLAHE